MQSNPRRKKNRRRLVVTFDLHNGVFILNAFSFEKKNVLSLSMSPFFPSHREHTHTTTNTTTTTTDDEKTNRNVWCSLISLSRSLSLFLDYPNYHMGFSLSLFSAVFLPPYAFSLSLARSMCFFFSRFYLPESVEGLK